VPELFDQDQPNLLPAETVQPWQQHPALADELTRDEYARTFRFLEGLSTHAQDDYQPAHAEFGSVRVSGSALPALTLEQHVVSAIRANEHEDMPRSAQSLPEVDDDSITFVEYNEACRNALMRFGSLGEKCIWYANLISPDEVNGRWGSRVKQDLAQIKKEIRNEQ